MSLKSINMMNKGMAKRTGIPERILSGILSLLFLTAILPQASFSQPYRAWRDTTLPAEKKPYGIAASDFPIGFYALNYNFARPLPELWSYMERQGFNLVEIFVEKQGNNPLRNETKWERYQSFLHSPLRPAYAKLIPAIEYWPSILAESGQGQEIIFYPFDSAQTQATDYHTRHAFEHVAADYTEGRTAYGRRDGRGNSVRESIYEPENAGTKVLAGICYNWSPGRMYRFPRYYDAASGSWKDRPGDSVCITDLLLREKRQPTDRYYVVVNGHLFPGGTAAETDSLLRINLYYEVPYGENYYDSSGTLRKADANERFHYATLWVRKGDLLPADREGPEWEAERSVALGIDLSRCESCGMGGPLYPGNQSRRFDLEVLYLGREELALHSVALRDSITNLLMSDEATGRNYRRRLFAEVDSLITDGEGKVLDQIFALSPVGEPSATNYAGFREVDRLLRERYRNGKGEGLKAWTEWGTPYVQHLGEADWVVPEAYFNALGGHPQSHCCEEAYDLTSPGMFHVDHMQPPSIRQHNGGRWNIPELFDLDSLGNASYDAGLPQRIASYEETIQTGFYGWYSGGEVEWPFNGTRLAQLGREARNAKANGRRMLAIIGPNSYFRILKFDTRSNRRDTLVSHRYERAELRGLTNLAVFGYGAKGISYYDMSLSPWLRAGEGGSYYSDVIGFGGEWTGDTTRDIFDFAFRPPNKADTITLVKDFFLGLRSTHQELREINHRLREIGPILTGLRWRDAYSLHWQARRPGKDVRYTPRPLPPDEIVTRVRSWHPITGLNDAPWETYVELGLFETQTRNVNGMRDRMKDTNYVGVVNRRGFERPEMYDITYSAAAGRVMDTLSETRTIELRIHLANPDTLSQYNRFIRVREVLPDTASLPIIGRRLPLDTIIQHDIQGNGTVRLTLGAGRAALLEITYLGPQEALEVWRRE